jgi:hypothetical protein
MLSWGIVLMCNAAVKNKGGLFTTRFLLGVVCDLVKHLLAMPNLLMLQ